MRYTEIDFVTHAREVLENILHVVPNVTDLEWDLDQRSDQKELAGLVDLTVGVKTSSRLDTLVVELKTEGHPRQLRAAVDQLLRYRHRSRRNDYPVVAAPYITADGAALCKEENVGYFDLAGNCRLAFGPYFIERTGNPNPTRTHRVTTTPSLYAPKSERILRILFADHQKAWKVVPLADRAQVSLGTVSAVRTLLLEREWAKESTEGIQLTHPEKLLTDWATIWVRRRERPATYFTLTPLGEIERQMAAFARERKHPFALTGTAGAWRVAPMTKYLRTQAYWDGDLAELAQGLSLKSAENGANVQILQPRDAGVFFHQEEFDGVPIVAPLQLYLDLKRDPARGEEAAAEIWRTKLFPKNAKTE